MISLGLRYLWCRYLFRYSQLVLYPGRELAPSWTSIEGAASRGSARNRCHGWQFWWQINNLFVIFPTRFCLELLSFLTMLFDSRFLSSNGNVASFHQLLHIVDKYVVREIIFCPTDWKLGDSGRINKVCLQRYELCRGRERSRRKKEVSALL